MIDSKEPNQGHWEGETANPHGSFGFIYRVDVEETGQAYIGKRQFWKAKPGAKHCKSKVADKGSSKWKSSCWLENLWRNYSGSSKNFTKFMEENPQYTYTHTIIKNCRSRGILVYWEAKYQWECEVLEATLDNGNPKYFNNQIGGIRFRPRLEVSDETRRKMSETAKKGNYSELRRDKREYILFKRDLKFSGTREKFLKEYPDTSEVGVGKLLVGIQKTHKGWSLSTNPPVNLKNNTSGIKGVTWCKERSKWASSIKVNGKHKGLGRHILLSEAAFHRLAAEQCLGFEDYGIRSSAYKYTQGNK